MTASENLNNSLGKFGEAYREQIKLIAENTKKCNEKNDLNDKPLQSLKAELQPILVQIARTGEIEGFEWKPVRDFLIIMTRDVLLMMRKQFPDVLSGKQEDTFDEELDVILEYLIYFEDS